MRKIKPSLILIFAAIFAVTAVWPVAALAKRQPERVDNKTGLYDIVIDQLKQKERDYASQAKKINKELKKLQKQQVKLAKQKEVKKNEALESRIDSLVISLADLENKAVLARRQIEQFQKRKDGIELTLELESELGTDKKFKVKKRYIEDIKAGADKNKDADFDKSEYKVSPHDELQINVYDEQDLTKTVRVAVDGTISYPLLGRVNVGGLTAQELEEKIANLLREGGYILSPQVNVFVQRFSSVSILGEVRTPGSYELKGKLSVMDSIAQAGGFNIDADINNVKILRYEDGQQKTMQIRLGDLKKGIEGADIVLRANDTIFVEKIGKIAVLGEVTRPGTFELKDKVTVIEAIALAGGFTDIAAMNRTRIIREDPASKKKVIRVKVTDITYRGRKDKDIELLPGDIVYVPESLF